MKRLGWLLMSFALLASTSACKAGTHSLSDDGPESDCAAPRLSVVGHAHQHGALPVRPGQTLRLHGVHYTDDCAAGGAGTGRTIAKLQLGLESVHRIGPVATVHPHGRSSAFTVSVTIPTTTLPGPAKIFDVLAPPHGVVRLVVRR
jgi:hypothetical protein